METTEKIVEAYCRYLKNYFTIANVKIKNDEIDLLAVDTSRKTRVKRFHIEISVSISTGFSKLTAIKFDPQLYKERNTKAAQRRTIDFFITRKFNKPEFKETLKQFGFENNNYQKVIVSSGWTEEAKIIATKNKIELWDFRDIIHEIGEYFKDDKTYFKDDTLRTLQLYIAADKFHKKNNGG